MEACDKGGNFIGWLYCEGQNHSIALLEVQILFNVCTIIVVSQSQYTLCRDGDDTLIRLNNYNT